MDGVNVVVTLEHRGGGSVTSIRGRIIDVWPADEVPSDDEVLQYAYLTPAMPQYQAVAKAAKVDRLILKGKRSHTVVPLNGSTRILFARRDGH